MGDYVTLKINKPVRLIHTGSLMQPRAFKDRATGAEGAPRYNCRMLIESDNPFVIDIMTIALKLAHVESPARGIKALVGTQGLQAAYLTLLAQGLRLPMQNGNSILAEKAAAGKDCPYYQDVWVLNASKNEKTLKGVFRAPPALRVLQNGKIVPYDDEARPLAKNYFYNGVKASAEVQFHAYAGMGGGVSCSPEYLMSLNTGDRIQIGRSDEDIFGSPDSYAEYVGTVTNESVIAGMPDAPAGGTTTGW
jgi:hypothetical protein